jgi:hypothetical protein
MNDKGFVALNWTTASGENVDRFEIEHSIDGIQFDKIGIEKANEYPSEYLYFSDEYIRKVNNYYRLKILDIDGSFEYSATRHIFWKNQKNYLFILILYLAVFALQITVSGNCLIFSSYKFSIIRKPINLQYSNNFLSHNIHEKIIKIRIYNIINFITNN